MIQRPGPQECNEYYFLYIDQVPDGDVLDRLEQQIHETVRLLESIPRDRHEYSYEPGKWTPKQVLGHVIDVERVFTFRALGAARKEPAPLPSFEQDPYVENSRYGERDLADILAEFQTVRQGSLALFRSFNNDEWGRTVVASGFDFTARSIPFILAGHEIHHYKVLKERYV